MARNPHSDFCPEVSQKLLVPRCPQDASRWLQIAQDSLQDSPRWLPIAQDRLKLAQKGSQGRASWAKIAPKLFQQSSKILQDGQRCHIWEVSWKFLVPRCARDEPKWLRLSQDSPKLIQKTPITAPRRGRLGRDNPRLLPSCSNKIPKSLKMATYESKIDATRYETHSTLPELFQAFLSNQRLQLSGTPCHFHGSLLSLLAQVPCML